MPTQLEAIRLAPLTQQASLYPIKVWPNRAVNRARANLKNWWFAPLAAASVSLGLAPSVDQVAPSHRSQ